MRVIVTGLALLLMTAPAAAQSESSSPPTTTITIDYREPTTKSDGTPLQALKSIRLYWQVDGGPETVVTLPASSSKGGLDRRLTFKVPATSGVLSVTLTAIDILGNESARTAPLTKTIAPSAAKE
jgi:hypothetical protein